MDEKARRKRSYAAGYLLNLAGKPLPLSTKREPVAYLYNGVRLPKLPEWDREMYPYASITRSGEKYFFRAYGEPLMTKEDSPYLEFEDGEAIVVIYELQDDLWFFHGESSSTGGMRQPLVWTGFDVLNEDGSVYFAASDPNPVYE